MFIFPEEQNKSISRHSLCMPAGLYSDVLRLDMWAYLDDAL